MDSFTDRNAGGTASASALPDLLEIPGLTPEQVEVVRAWARRTPLVRVAWVYGSRAKGTSRPDSDLDVAVEVHPRPGMTERETYLDDLAWMSWEYDLADELGLVVHLVQLREEGTPTVTRGVREAGIAIHRNEAPPSEWPDDAAAERDLFDEVTRQD